MAEKDMVNPIRDSMVFYKSFREAIKELPEENQLEALWAIIDYGLDGIKPSGGGIATAIYMMARPQIDANNKRYLNGKNGGRPKTSKEDNHQITKVKPKVNQDITKPEPNVNVNDNVNDNVNVNDKKIIYSPAFADFWEAYPRKKEKQKAYKCFLSRLKDNFSEVQLIEAAKKYAEECRVKKTSDEYIKHPATFLGPSLPFADYLSDDYKPPTPRNDKKNGFHNFEQRTYDYDALLKQINNNQ